MNTAPVSQRYIQKVSVGHPGECWGWVGSTTVFGYGQIHHEGRLQQAHRVAWTLANGPIPDGMWVLHRCDNPPCTNPDHLFLGSRKDNMMDAARKGRIATHAKLTPDQVHAIRSSQQRGADLAREYNVSPALISMIIHRQRWAGTTEA